MPITGTMPNVTSDLTLRQFAGTLVFEEIARKPGGRKTEKVIEDSGLSRSTLRNIRAGNEAVKPETFWALAAALDLPTHFFGYIIDGDIERIERLPGIREDLRQHVVETMRDLVLPRSRRASDRRKRA